jgi:sugar lactone lactonase YvrE
MARTRGRRIDVADEQRPPLTINDFSHPDEIDHVTTRNQFASSALLALAVTAATVLAGLRADGPRTGKLVLVAGGGTQEENVPATEAKLNQPFGIGFDKSGNFYLVELAGQRVLKVDAKGLLTVFAGTGKKGHIGDSGPARSAAFNGMHSLAVGNDILYLTDTWNNRVRKIDLKTGTISAFAGTGKKGHSGDGGPAVEALFGGIYCAALDPAGEKLYLADLDNRGIRAVDLKTGVVERKAGNGRKGVPRDGDDARTSPLVDPRAVAVDRSGNVYILERGGHALRVVDANGKIRTVAGTGKPGNTGDGGDARKATLNSPKHLCIDTDDSVLIADSSNHVIRRYTPSDGKIVRVVGTGKKGDSGKGGSPLEVSLNEPHGVCVRADGMAYIVDSMNQRVFRWER